MLCLRFLPLPRMLRLRFLPFRLPLVCYAYAFSLSDHPRMLRLVNGVLLGVVHPESGYCTLLQHHHRNLYFAITVHFYVSFSEMQKYTTAGEPFGTMSGWY